MDLMGKAAFFCTAHGMSLRGTRILEVRGRRSGLTRATLINVLTLDDAQWVVGVRGDGDWTRNLRAAHCATIRLGRRRTQVRADEIGDTEKTVVLRAYLRRWAFEVAPWFVDVRADSSDDVIAGVAHRYPVFRLTHFPL